MAKIINIDLQIEDADWTKGTWDLPPFGSDEFNDFLRATGKTLEDFKKLPVYKWAVERGEIKE